MKYVVHCGLMKELVAFRQYHIELKFKLSALFKQQHTTLGTQLKGAM